MSTFEIEGKAKKEVICDIANIRIRFRSRGTNAYDVSKKVMDECDAFLEEMQNRGMKLSDIHYDGDEVEESRFHDNDSLYADRVVKMCIPFDLKVINAIQSVLHDGKFEFYLDVSGDVSNRQELYTELTKEALRNSKHAAEELAGVLGIKVKGVESIRKNGWDDDSEVYDDVCEQERVSIIESISRPSDEVGGQVIEESVRLNVKWILEE